ncbi:MAG: methyltransferase domain-containing protein [Chitinophagaceae bacterium]
MSTTIKETNWNAGLYDDKHAFVFKYGEDLVNVLNPLPGERVLDLGCGTGYLTQAIADRGAIVTGIDNSVDMILKAKATFPELEFKVQSATDFYYDEPFDAVFSNAVLHWVLDKEEAIDCIYANLKRSGRLVLEMGGKTNVQNIITTLEEVLIKHGYAENAQQNPWYFPSVSEYTALLEKRGFRVTYAAHYNRDTELNDNENGIKDWIRMFGSSFLNGIPDDTVDGLLDEVQDQLRSTNFRYNKWYADYKRLRIIAIKEGKQSLASI